MSQMLESDVCPACGARLERDELVVPIWRVVHRGRVHTEVEPTRQVAHVICPTTTPDTKDRPR